MSYSGSPNSHHQKMAARDPKDAKPPLGSRAGIFFSRISFASRSRDGLSERGITRAQSARGEVGACSMKTTGNEPASRSSCTFSWTGLSS